MKIAPVLICSLCSVSAVTELKCDALDKDKNNLIKKYKAKQSVIDAINKAEKEFY